VKSKIVEKQVICQEKNNFQTVVIKKLKILYKKIVISFIF